MAAIYGDHLTIDMLKTIEVDDVSISRQNADGLTPEGAFVKRKVDDQSLIDAFNELLLSQKKYVTVSEKPKDD